MTKVYHWYGWRTPGELSQELGLELADLCNWLEAAIEAGKVLSGRIRHSAVSVPVFRCADQRPPR